ncbi:unnamed protein product [Phytophthora fragariaefolia]|uniref:Unnamed protein product n=1 Tax=Phytophthora fragariaefolia TaxID=1490495 RepID=A0A9W7D5S0_9STRA|nr:unnamed protein product [Phytophthora fragariaefolia]
MDRIARVQEEFEARWDARLDGVIGFRMEAASTRKEATQRQGTPYKATQGRIQTQSIGSTAPPDLSRRTTGFGHYTASSVRISTLPAKIPKSHQDIHSSTLGLFTSYQKSKIQPYRRQSWEVGSSNLADFADPATPHKYQLVMEDNFSHFCELVPCDSPTSEVTVEGLLEWHSSQLSRVFHLPNQAYRVRSCFLATRQRKKELVDYVQELRTLIAGMAVDPLPEAVTVTVLMEGLRTGVARTEVFRTHSTSFEEAVNVELNAEFNFKSSRLGWNASYANPSSGPEPMELSYAEDEEAGLLAAEQRPFEQKPCFGPELGFVSGKREVPVGAGRPTGEELSSVEPHGDGGQQGLAPKRAVLSNTERVCKPGLLVVQATVKGFGKPWTILVDSGASGNYARRSTMEGSQLYAEALKARTRDIVTVRLATGTRVTVPNVPVDLGVKFLDFDSVERCLVLDLDARYDLILVMNPPLLGNRSASGASTGPRRSMCWT